MLLARETAYTGGTQIIGYHKGRDDVCARALFARNACVVLHVQGFPARFTILELDTIGTTRLAPSNNRLVGRIWNRMLMFGATEHLRRIRKYLLKRISIIEKDQIFVTWLANK